MIEYFRDTEHQANIHTFLIDQLVHKTYKLVYSIQVAKHILYNTVCIGRNSIFVLGQEGCDIWGQPIQFVLARRYISWQDYYF